MPQPQAPKIEERRFIAKAELRIDAAEAGKPRVMRGYAAVFNSVADLGYFREAVLPGAFKNCLSRKDDVRALFNHDPNLVLGRTSAGTLRLSEDDKGLRVEVDIPDTTCGRDLAVSMDRGDVNQMSFAFTPVSDRWSLRDGMNFRELIELDISDVSPVTYPAYTDTSAAMQRCKSAGAGGGGDVAARAKATLEAIARQLLAELG